MIRNSKERVLGEQLRCVFIASRVTDIEVIMRTISLGHDMLTERMHHMIDDVLPGGFLPTICGTDS